ncbi:hypothetical protein HDU98_003952 [Podochytrium sp. JEL0797]|nr:hypothetical protein HDU98_003952 [Podochytrium sp. JEL0797]
MQQIPTDYLAKHFDSQSTSATPFGFTVRESSIANGSTTIRCGLIDSVIPQRYCETSNIALNMDRVPQLNEMDAGLDLPPKHAGVLESTCSVFDESTWTAKAFGGGAAGWMHSGGIISETSDIPCSATVTTPVFFISRWDTTNPYQFHQDALNTFLVYSLLDLDPAEIQPVLLDRRSPDGPYTAAWSHLFGGGMRLLDVRQLRDGALDKLDPADGGSGNICFRQAVWGIHGGISPLSRNGRIKNSWCTHAPLMLAFRQFMIDRMRLAVLGESAAATGVPLPVPERHKLDVEKDVERAILQRGWFDMDEVLTIQEKVMTVTYAVRSASTNPAPIESSVLSQSQIHGLRANASPPVQSITPPKLSRFILNDDEVQQTIKEAVFDWSVKNGVSAQVRAVDFATLSFEDQVSVAQGTDYFIGPHGASFAYLLYLRKSLGKAAVLELKPPERTMGNHQFHNLATRLGHL